MKLIYILFFLITVFLPFRINAQQKEVTAEKGDGIHSLLTRNGLSPAEYTNAFIELNKNSLGKENTLLAGVKYKLPDSKAPVPQATEKTVTPATSGTGTFKTYEIFGAAWKNVEITGNDLNGAIYYLVPGHGGPDPGAMGKFGNDYLCEDEYAYDVTLRLARNLIQRGALVYMIVQDPNDGIRDESILKADKDEFSYPNLSIPLNQVKRLKQRTDAVNSLYSKNRTAFQRMISIHVDSRSHGENIDVFFYHDKRSKTGEKAAKILQKTFQDKYDTNQPGRGYKGTVSTRNLYEIQNTYPAAVYIELGNINHQRDQQRFIIANNRQALANWLTQGLVTDFQTNK